METNDDAVWCIIYRQKSNNQFDHNTNQLYLLKLMNHDIIDVG